MKREDMEQLPELGNQQDSHEEKCQQSSNKRR